MVRNEQKIPEIIIVLLILIAVTEPEPIISWSSLMWGGALLFFYEIFIKNLLPIPISLGQILASYFGMSTYILTCMFLWINFNVVGSKEKYGLVFGVLIAIYGLKRENFYFYLGLILLLISAYQSNYFQFLFFSYT